MELDLLLRVVPRRASVAKSCWLREEGSIFKLDEIRLSTMKDFVVTRDDFKGFFFIIVLSNILWM